MVLSSKFQLTQIAQTSGPNHKSGAACRQTEVSTPGSLGDQLSNILSSVPLEEPHEKGVQFGVERLKGAAFKVLW
jgi:hypothetical protein